MNIIIVDDDPFVTGALKTILESTGEITVKAMGTDGKEACELYEKYQPDVRSEGFGKNIVRFSKSECSFTHNFYR